MFRFTRGLVWILAAGVIGAPALVYVGLFGPEPQELLGTRSTSAGDSASPAGPRPRAGQLAALRENKGRRAAGGRPDPGVDAPVRQPIHHEAGSSLAADERLESKEGAAPGARALRPRTTSPVTRVTEVPEDRVQGGAEHVARVTLSRAGPQSTGRDAESPDDWTAPERPWRRNDERNRGLSIERDGGRGEIGDQGTDGVSDRVLQEVSVGSPVMMTCATEPWICNAFSLALILPDTIPAVSDGTKAVQFRIAGGPDIVWIRTESGVIEVATENLTDVDQLAALIDQLVPPR